MRSLLSASAHPVLQKFAQDKTLCAFDFDGTLAPIVDHPDHAGMRQTTVDLLESLAAVFPCIVISGRARADVLQMRVRSQREIDRLLGVVVSLRTFAVPSASS